VTTVFFLFLLHLSLGLVGALGLVPARAGERFFKLCAASSVAMTAAALWLLYRRFGLGADDAPASYPLLLGLGLAHLAFTLLYNRAWHFSWRRLQGPALAGSLAAGLGAALAGTPGPLFAAADLASAFLLGVTAAAMILGHYYLVVLDLPISALRRLTVLFMAALAVRTATVALALAGPNPAGLDEARQIALGLWSPDGIFVWMRLLFGLAGPAALAWFVWKTVEIRSTQSATGILYIQLFLVLAGELLAKYLRVAAGFPL
jgi:hypothetical protein